MSWLWSQSVPVINKFWRRGLGGVIIFFGWRSPCTRQELHFVDTPKFGQWTGFLLYLNNWSTLIFFCAERKHESAPWALLLHCLEAARWLNTNTVGEAETCHILAFFLCSCCLGTKHPRAGVWRKNSSIFMFKCLLLGSNQYLYLKKIYFSTFPAHCFGFIVCNNPTDSVCHCLLKSTTAVSTKKCSHMFTTKHQHTYLAGQYSAQQL